MVLILLQNEKTENADPKKGGESGNEVITVFSRIQGKVKWKNSCNCSSTLAFWYTQEFLFQFCLGNCHRTFLFTAKKSLQNELNYSNICLLAIIWHALYSPQFETFTICHCYHDMQQLGHIVPFQRHVSAGLAFTVCFCQVFVLWPLFAGWLLACHLVNHIEVVWFSILLLSQRRLSKSGSITTQLGVQFELWIEFLRPPLGSPQEASWLVRMLLPAADADIFQ